jgi:hypothetical protein
VIYAVPLALRAKRVHHALKSATAGFPNGCSDTFERGEPHDEVLLQRLARNYLTRCLAETKVLGAMSFRFCYSFFGKTIL